jgi:hypothetical protein
VEGKIPDALRLYGLRQGRYFGQEKTDLQALVTASMVNTKRLLHPARGRRGAYG